MADGKIIIDVDVITKRSEENIKSLERAMKNSGDNISQENENSANKFANDWNKAKSQYEKSANEILAIQKQLNQIEIDSSSLQGRTDMTSVMKLQEMDLLSQSLIDKQDVLNAKNEGYSLQMDIAGQKALELATNIRQADIETQKLKGANVENLSVTQKMGVVIGVAIGKVKQFADKTLESNRNMKQLEQSSKGMSKGVGGGLKNVIKYAGALFGIRSIYTGLRRLSSEWLNSDQAGAQQAKANIQAISSALANALAPVLIWIADLVMTIVGYANALLKALFGIDLFAKSTAKSTGKTAKNTGSTAKGLKDANKELKKFTAGFDDAEVVSGNLADNLAGGAGAGDLDGFSPQIQTPDVSKFANAINAIKDALQPFIDTLKSIDLQPLQDAFKRLGTATLGAMQVMGDSIISMMNNSLAPFIKLMAEEIVPRAINAVAYAIEQLTPYLEYFMTNLAEPWVDWVLMDLYPAWADFLISSFELLTEVVKKMLDGLIKWWEFIEPVVKWLGDVAVKAIQGVTDSIKELTGDVKENDGGFGDLIVTVGLLVGGFLTFITVSFLVGKAVGAVTAVIALLSKAFGAIMVVVKLVAGVFTAAFGGSLLAIIAIVVLLGLMLLGLATNFEQVKDDFMVIVGNIKGIFTGLWDFIAGVFTGNWRRAFKGLADAVINAFAGIANIVKFPINLIVDGVNAMIRGLNKIKIPSWVPAVGGKGINLPQVPRLAKGGVLTQPTLNIAGEYPNAKRNPEIVTPQNIMEETFAKVMAQQGNQGGTYVFEVNLDGQKIASVTKDKNELNKLQLNGAW